MYENYFWKYIVIAIVTVISFYAFMSILEIIIYYTLLHEMY